MNAFLVLLMILCSHEIWAKELVLDDPFKKASLSDFAKLAITDADTKIHQLLEANSFHPSDKWTYGLTTDTYWLKIPIYNPGSAKKIYFEFSYPLLEKVTAFISPENQEPLLIGVSGVGIPGQLKPIHHRQILFPIAVNENSRMTIYVQVSSSGSMNLKGTVWLDAEMLNDLDNRTMIISLFYGAMFALLFYNFILYFLTHDKTSLYYCLFLGSAILFFATWNGLGHLYLWPDYPYVGHRILILSSMQLIFWAIIFSINYLELPKYSKNLTLICRIFAFCTIVLTIVTQFLSYSNALKIMIPCTLVSSSLTFVMGVRGWIAGSYIARIYLFAGFMFICGSLIAGLSSSNTIPMTNLGQYSSQLGCALDAIFLSFGLGYRIKYLKKEKFAMETKMMDTINDKQHFITQLEKVFYTHQIDLIESGRSLEQTMPTEKAEAAVIVFDIISSSRLNHENTKKFIRNLFNRCYQSMMGHYDPEAGSADAYRIKELGDGFLCSVGYPFKTPQNRQKSVTAIKLIDDFTRIFSEEVQKFDYPAPIYFSIGVALGEIHGFYPEVGPKEYDLFGDAIMLATRYESMRTQIFKGDIQSSIIVLQERFYNSLPRTYRDRFKILDLEKYNIRVRDDASATKLYYHLVNELESEFQRVS